MNITKNNKGLMYIIQFHLKKNTFFKYLFLFLKRKKFRSVISNDKKLVFVHIPKNAGSSMNQQMKFATIGHVKLSELYHLGILKKTTTEDLEFVCVVRNPFERLVSLYHYFIDTNDQIHKDGYGWNLVNKEMRAYKTFAEFIKHIDTFRFNYLNSFDTQSSFVTVPNLDLNITYLRFENLKYDYEKLAARYDLSDLQNKNKSVADTKALWKSFYSDKNTIDTVYALFKDDIDRWYPDSYYELVANLSR